MFRKIVVSILAFFLTILIVLSIVLGTYNSQINKKAYLLKTLEDTNFYAHLKESIEDHLEGYVLQSGLPEDIFKDFITEDFVKTLVNANIGSFYDYINKQEPEFKINVNTSSLETELRQRISKFAEENQLTFDETQTNSVEQYVKLVLGSLELNSTISSIVYSASDLLVLINEMYRTVMGLTIICIAIFVVLIFVIGKKVTTNITFILASLFSTGLILRIVIEVLGKNEILTNFYLFSPYFSNTVIAYIQGILSQLRFITNITLIVAPILVIFTIIGYYMGKKRRM